MGYIRNFEKDAIDFIYNNSLKFEGKRKSSINNIFCNYNIYAENIIEKLLLKKVTINFHPDRLSSNGKLIIKNMITDGKYLNQFQTGTTNGGRTAYFGGERFLWEEKIFGGIYPKDTQFRPKYGALNIFNYIDGATSRFGSCYFTLNNRALERCTFSYGDSYNNPEILCSNKSFYGILYGMLTEVIKNEKFLDIKNCCVDEFINTMLSIDIIKEKIGRNLDNYIEVHIHGDISLEEDIESLYLDEAFKKSIIQDYAEVLASKYSIKLKWIPKRQIKIEDIDDEFRGDKMKPLSYRINNMFGDNSGYIDALQLGKASCSSITSKEVWSDFGSEDELFIYFKQLWHILAFYG